MVFSRVSKRLRTLGIQDRSKYCDLITNAKDERRFLINALTTNVTDFFREAHHFETLSQTVLAPVMAKAGSNERIRIWSAGCSSGQEPYSIAMTVLEKIPDAVSRNIRILATDIDSQILEIAKKGEYSSSQVSNISPNRLKRFFEPTTGAKGEISSFAIKDNVKNLISFRELNLLSAWPMKGKFNAIFCRNVVIYFDRNTQSNLWPRFLDKCVTNGYLFVGHSERLDETSLRSFQNCGTTTYRKRPEAN
jgi:chemotaxis protein methyltransferase CheR